MSPDSKFSLKKSSQKRENSITQQQFLRQWQSLCESELVTSPLSLLSVLFLINTFDDDIKKSQMYTEKECSERDSMEWNCYIKQGWKTWTFFYLYQFSTSMSSSKGIFNYLVFRSSTLNLISRLLFVATFPSRTPPLANAAGVSNWRLFSCFHSVNSHFSSYKKRPYHKTLPTRW